MTAKLALLAASPSMTSSKFNASHLFHKIKNKTSLGTKVIAEM
jgi:hypothetical protein